MEHYVHILQVFSKVWFLALISEFWLFSIWNISKINRSEFWEIKAPFHKGP